MQIVFIYGFPASGKLSVAKELSKLTGYPVFHNHLVVDVVDVVLSNKDRSFWPLTQKLRLEIIKAAIKENKPGLIMTQVYTGNEDKMISQLVDLVRKHKGKIRFVHLACEKTDLYKRVGNASRKKHGKMTTKKRMNEFLELFGNVQSIKRRPSLTINTSELSAKHAAQKIHASL